MTYRQARRAFIAACEKAHVETVSRLHPSKGPDGKPLFMDCAAIGPRRAGKAVLILGYDAPGSAMLIALLSETLPSDAKLVLVHALDPAAFAGVKTDPAWPATALQAEVTEDLLHVRHLAVLPLGRGDDRLVPVLQAQLPNAVLIALPHVSNAAKARAAIGTFFAGN